MRSLQREFEEHYFATSEKRPGKKDRITYQYIGPLHVWDLSDDNLKKKKVQFVCLLILLLLLYGFSAVTETDINIVGWSTVFLSLSLIALLFESVGIFQFLLSKKQFSESDAHSMNAKLRISPIMLCILLLCAIVAGLGTSNISYSLPVYIGYLLCISISICLYSMARHLPMKVIKNPLAEKLKLQKAE